MKKRLDYLALSQGIASTRSQAENYIKLGMVFVNGEPVTKPGHFVPAEASIELRAAGTYVSRAGMKLASVASALNLSFTGKTVLDVGSSTGGFTDFALQNGASTVIAVDVGTEQLHPKLRQDKRVQLYEKTDIRTFRTNASIDYILIDVSFVSLRDILPSIKTFCSPKTHIIAMCKPQFEAGKNDTNKGVIKNDTLRRDILKKFEAWLKENGFVVQNKADSEVAGSKGNRERFYRLTV